MDGKCTFACPNGPDGALCGRSDDEFIVAAYSVKGCQLGNYYLNFSKLFEQKDQQKLRYEKLITSKIDIY